MDFYSACASKDSASRYDRGNIQQLTKNLPTTTQGPKALCINGHSHRIPLDRFSVLIPSQLVRKTPSLHSGGDIYCLSSCLGT